MLFDSHTHLNLAAFDTDRDTIIKKYLKEGIFMINVGTNYLTSKKASEIASQYSNCWASVGLHPSHVFPNNVCSIDLQEFQKKDLRVKGEIILPEVFDESFEKLIKDNTKVVAIGECGLDYSYLKDFTLKEQKQYQNLEKNEFIKQIKIAQKYHLPLILHVRDLYQEALKLLKENNYQGKAVFHFFTGTFEEAQLILAQGYYLGFSGVITYGHKMDEVIKSVPLNRILIETDAPYVAPVPYRGTRNESQYVVEVAKKIAELKHVSLEEIEKITFENAKQLFQIK
ncbi:MAG: TatD family hydrolase [Minisyncoccia bacterium]